MFTIQIHFKVQEKLPEEETAQKLSVEDIEILIESTVSSALLSFFDAVKVIEVDALNEYSDIEEVTNANIRIQIPKDAFKTEVEEGKSIEDLEMSVEEIVSISLLTVFDKVFIDKVIILPDISAIRNTSFLNAFPLKMPRFMLDTFRNSLLILGFISSLFTILSVINLIFNFNPFFKNFLVGLLISLVTIIGLSLLISIITLIFDRTRELEKGVEKNKNEKIGSDA